MKQQEKEAFQDCQERRLQFEEGFFGTISDAAREDYERERRQIIMERGWKDLSGAPSIHLELCYPKEQKMLADYCWASNRNYCVGRHCPPRIRRSLSRSSTASKP